MSIKKLLYPVDFTGEAQTNRIVGELHTIGKDRYRAFALNYGYFYSDNIRIVERGKVTPLVPGVDFKCLYFARDISKLAKGKEVCGVVLIMNEAIGTELEVSYNLVGGHYANYAGAIAEAIVLLELDNRNVYWKDILLKPDLFQPAPHAHDIGDVYGLEFLIDVLTQLINAILIGDNAVHQEILNALDKLRSDLTVAHNAHLADKNNPHGTTAEQVNAYTKEVIDAYLAAIAKRFDGLEPRFQSILNSVNAIIARLAGHDGQLEAQSDRIGQAELDVSRLFSQTGGSASDIEVINGQIASILAVIETLKQKDTALEGLITNNANEIKAIKLVNTNQDNQIAAIVNKNNEQDGRLNSHNATLNQHANSINSINQTLATKLSSVPPATSAAYGGFKYTFNGGIFNMYI